MLPGNASIIIAPLDVHETAWLEATYTMSESKVIANQQTIIKNQKTILANQAELRANQTIIKKNQASILKNQTGILKNQGALSTIIENQKKILAKLSK